MLTELINTLMGLSLLAVLFNIIKRNNVSAALESKGFSIFNKSFTSVLFKPSYCIPNTVFAVLKS